MKILCWFTLLAVVVSVSAEGSGFDPEGSGLDPEGSDLVTCNNKADDNNPEVKSRVCEDWMLMGYCTHPDADTRKRTHELCMKSCAPVIGVQCEEDPNDIKNMLGSWDEFEEWLNCPSCLMGSCGCQLFNCCTEQYMGTMEWEEWQKGQGKMWALYGPWQHNWQEKTASGVIQGYDSEHPESPEYETADPEGCTCKNLTREGLGKSLGKKFGNCNEHYGKRGYCYVNQPSTCSDLKPSINLHDEQVSYEACDIKNYDPCDLCNQNGANSEVCKDGICYCGTAPCNQNGASGEICDTGKCNCFNRAFMLHHQTPCASDQSCNWSSGTGVCGNIYKKVDKKHCASDVDYGYGYYDSVWDAKAACSRDWNCQSVYDSGCVSKRVYLCPFGSNYSSSVSSCIYEKDFAAYGVPEYGSGDYSDYDYADYEAAYGVPEYGSGDYSDYDYADYEGSN